MHFDLKISKIQNTQSGRNKVHHLHQITSNVARVWGDELRELQEHEGVANWDGDLVFGGVQHRLAEVHLEDIVPLADHRHVELLVVRHLTELLGRLLGPASLKTKTCFSGQTIKLYCIHIKLRRKYKICIE